MLVQLIISSLTAVTLCDHTHSSPRSFRVPVKTPEVDLRKLSHHQILQLALSNIVLTKLRLGVDALTLAKSYSLPT